MNFAFLGLAVAGVAFVFWYPHRREPDPARRLLFVLGFSLTLYAGVLLLVHRTGFLLGPESERAWHGRTTAATTLTRMVHWLPVDETLAQGTTVYGESPARPDTFGRIGVWLAADREGSVAFSAIEILPDPSPLPWIGPIAGVGLLLLGAGAVLRLCRKGNAPR